MKMTTSNNQPDHPQQFEDRIIRRDEVLALTGFKKSTLHNRLNPKSRWYDPEFPRPICLSPSSGIVGWYLSEVLKWCATRPRVEA